MKNITEITDEVLKLVKSSFGEDIDTEVLHEDAKNGNLYGIFDSKNEIVAIGECSLSGLSDNTYAINWVCVREDCKGKGYGRIVVDFLENQIFKNDSNFAMILALCKKDKQSFYEKFEYQPIYTSTDNNDFVLMLKHNKHKIIHEEVMREIEEMTNKMNTAIAIVKTQIDYDFEKIQDILVGCTVIEDCGFVDIDMFTKDNKEFCYELQDKDKEHLYEKQDTDGIFHNLVYQRTGVCEDDYYGFLLFPLRDGNYWKVSYEC